MPPQDNLTNERDVLYWPQERIDKWLQENNLERFCSRIKNGKVLKQLYKDTSWISRLGNWETQEQQKQDTEKLIELLHCIFLEDKSPKESSRQPFQSPKSQTDTKALQESLQTRINNTSFPRNANQVLMNNSDFRKRKEWDLWVKIEFKKPFRITGINPTDDIQKLKFIVKNETQLGLQSLLLADFSLKSQGTGHMLDNSKKIFEELHDGDTVEIQLASPESLLGDFAQYQSIQEAVMIDLDNPEWQIDLHLPEPYSSELLQKLMVKDREGKDERDLEAPPTFIVGIGTSAGGLEPLQSFFDHLDPQTGMGFVVIQHLSPNHKTIMVELLSKHTAMEVFLAENGQTVEPNCVYVIPPSVNMYVVDGKLYLKSQDRRLGFSYPINAFFKSLAIYKKDQAVGIILSGTGTDGQDGVRDIKEAGGMVMVQDETAQFDGMPKSAIKTGLVDYVLPPDLMAQRVVHYIRHCSSLSLANIENNLPVMDDLLQLFAILNKDFGVDFRKYNLKPIGRRIQHRMTLLHFKKLKKFLHYIKENQSERKVLFKDLLIPVTRFFRDDEVFNALEKQVIPSIVEKVTSTEPIRIWTVGCSTGEEAYSIGMIILDYLDKYQKNIPVKIYATDVDRDAIEFASNGVYDSSIVYRVSAERLAKFFITKGSTYQVCRRLREMVIFAHHNISVDPPFHKISFITCRNVMLYFKTMLQLKVLSLFHYSLKEGGVLLLGACESVNQEIKAFKRIFGEDRKLLNFYTAEHISIEEPPPLKTPTTYPKLNNTKYTGISNLPRRSVKQSKLIESVHKVWQTECVPPSVVVDQTCSVVKTFGDISPFFNLNSEDTNLLKKAWGKELQNALFTGLEKVAQENTKIVLRSVHVQTPHPEDPKFTDLRIVPVAEENEYGGQDRTFVIFFEAKDMREGRNVPSRSAMFNQMMEQLKSEGKDSNKQIYLSRIEDLQQDLGKAQFRLSATEKELAVSHEELQKTNEELLASNEELQATNEELQSVNEELYCLNSEFSAKIDELTELHNDLNNLLTSTNIGVIFLDEELKIRKFTSAVTRHVPVLEGDVGRPISHLANHSLTNIETEAKQVMKSKESLEKELHSGGDWFVMKILPYIVQSDHPYDQVPRGVVVTFFEITYLKRIEEKLRNAKNDAENALKSKQEFLATMSHEIRTPMNGICGFAELLLNSPDLSPEARECLEFISRSASMMLSMLHDILDLTYLESGKLSIVEQRFNLLNTIYRVGELLALISSQKNVELVVYCSPNCPVDIIGDELRIQQILVNLVSHAVQITNQGYVKLSVKFLGKRTNRNLSTSAPYLGRFRVKVKDTAKDSFPRNVTTSSNTRRAGMGISISNDLLKRMNAEGIRQLEGKDGRHEFSFHIELPIIEQGEYDSMFLRGSKELYNANMLYCEKPCEHSKVVLKTFYQMNLNTVFVDNENSIIEAVKKADKPITFCIVCLDILKKPRETIQELKSILHPNVPICVMVRVNQILGTTKAMMDQLGVHSILVKPLRIDKLQTLLIGEPNDSSEPKAVTTNVNFGNLSVLVAEDNLVNQKIAVRMLKTLGCDVKIACNGKEAVDMVKNENFAVIFMDLHMPEMDGMSATKEIINFRKEQNLPSIPVVALTAKVHPEGKEACLKAGMEDYLSKPITRQKLIALLSKLFPKLQQTIPSGR